MAAFEHVITLVSFVYAFALTYLLARIVALFDVRVRVEFSGLHAFMVVNAVLLVFINWLALWPFHTVVVWDFASIADNFCLAIVVFFTCAIAAPRASEGPIDLEGYYQHACKPYYWLIIVGNAVAALGNLDFLKSTDPTQFWTWTVASIAVTIPPVLALVIAARWAQWAAAVCFFVFALAIGAVLGNLR